MIIYRDNETEGFSTEGFTPSVLDMTIEVSEGKLTLRGVIHEYPSFSFDIESDELFDVIYDVYLLDTSEEDSTLIHIDRTEMGGDSFAQYQEDYKLLHCIATMMIPPKTNSLDNVQIIMNRVTNIEDYSEE